jgi:hypothetical protein
MAPMHARHVREEFVPMRSSVYLKLETIYQFVDITLLYNPFKISLIPVLHLISVAPLHNQSVSDTHRVIVLAEIFPYSIF